MSLIRRLPVPLAGLFLAAVSFLPAAEPVSAAGTAEIKRVTDRYALTRSRIGALLDMRLQPVALPANPPNPFYLVPRETLGAPLTPPQDAPENPGPETTDLSDSDVLRKYAAALKVSGVIRLNGVLHLTVNNTPCKVGDVIPVGNKDRPTYLKVVALSPTEFTLGLNEAILSLPLKK